MDRVILHSDINSCYASVERLYKPELEGKPFAVCGSQEMRHGIVLAKDETAKRAGVKTGMAIWQARQLTPSLKSLSRTLSDTRNIPRWCARYMPSIPTCASRSA